MVTPAMTEKDQGVGADETFGFSDGVLERLRLHREHDDVGGAGVGRVEYGADSIELALKDQDRNAVRAR